MSQQSSMTFGQNKINSPSVRSGIKTATASGSGYTVK